MPCDIVVVVLPGMIARAHFSSTAIEDNTLQCHLEGISNPAEFDRKFVI